MSEAEQSYVSQRLAEFLDDDVVELERSDALVANDELRDLLVQLDRSWSRYSSDDVPDDFADTELCKRLLRQYGSRRLLDLLDSSNTVGLGYLLGEDEDDVSRVEDSIPIQKVQRSIHNHGMPYYLWIQDKPKTAKTGTAASYIHWSEPMYGYEDLTVVSNVTTLERTDVPVSSHAELVDTTERKDAPIAVVLDEAGDFLDARSQRQYVSNDFMPWFRRTGKLGVVFIIFLSHGKDVHPMVRDQLTEVVRKPRRNKAVVYDRWSEMQDRPVGEKYHIPGIPEPPYSYNPNEESEFST